MPAIGEIAGNQFLIHWFISFCPVYGLRRNNYSFIQHEKIANRTRHKRIAGIAIVFVFISFTLTAFFSHATGSLAFYNLIRKRCTTGDRLYKQERNNAK